MTSRQHRRRPGRALLAGAAALAVAATAAVALGVHREPDPELAARVAAVTQHDSRHGSGHGHRRPRPTTPAPGVSTPPAASTTAPSATQGATPGATPGGTHSAGHSMPATSAVTEPSVVPAGYPAPGTPSTRTPPRTQYHEFQANCTITDHRPDDPIVFPGQPGASHDHAFFGNTTTNARSTLATLLEGGTSCTTPGDTSAYWMPTLFDGDRVVDPTETITYYKSGVTDHTSVRPFPTGFRMLVGSPRTTAAQFQGTWSCGNTHNAKDIPAVCPEGSKLIARLKAPSCWDGVHLDVPDHKSHVVQPVDGRCTAGHPVALPMLEFKIPYPVDGDMSGVRLSSGPGHTFHYDFFSTWDEPTLAALVRQCVNGGLQCDSRGYDQHHPGRGAALDENHRLP